MKDIKPVLSVILAGCLWGIINIFIRRLSFYGLDALQISLVRMFVAAVCFSAFLLIKDRNKLRIRLKDIWIFVCTGIVSVVVFNCCYFYTIIHSEASVAVVFLYTSPIFIMILSAIFFKEKITAKKIIALVLTLLGCVLVAGILGGVRVMTPLVILTGVLAGLFYGLYSIFGQIGLKKYDTETVTAWTFIFGFIGSIPLGKVGKTFTTIAENPILILWCIGIGIFCTVLPYFFYTWGLKRMDSGKAAILVAVEPLVAALIGIIFYHESHGILKILGIICILAAIVVMNLKEKENMTL